MASIISWIYFFAAAFLFGTAATVKLLAWVLVRNSEYAGGEKFLGNFISTIVALVGIYLMYLSISRF